MKSAFPRAPVPRFLAALCVLTLVGCDSKSRGEASSAARTDSDTASEPNIEIAPTPEPEEPPKPPAVADLERFTSAIEGDGALVALIETDFGRIDCKLHEKVAPRAVANFVGLALGMKAWRDPETESVVESKPFYDGVAFHYVVPGHFVQAGDRTGTGRGGPGYFFEDEIVEGLRHDAAGVLSMANTGPDTNGSQFFITEKPLPHLDGRHTIFGRCKSVEVVKAIARVPSGPQNRPETPPRIQNIEIVRMRW